MAKPLSPELRARVIAVGRSEPDLTHDEIAQRFGLGKGTVNNILNAAGVKRQHVSLSAIESSTHGALKRSIAKHRAPRVDKSEQPPP